MRNLKFKFIVKNTTSVLQLGALWKMILFLHEPSNCWVVGIGNRSPEWWWLKDKEGKSP